MSARLLFASCLCVLALALSSDVREARAETPQVCFYEHFNYQGRAACWKLDQSIARLRAVNYAGMNWNDQISSIKVYGGARALVCQNDDFGGWCLNIQYSFPDLSKMQLDGRSVTINDQISALRVLK